MKTLPFYDATDERPGGVRCLAECLICGKTDREDALILVRVKGEDRWVCVRCIPKLIHGG